MNIGSSAADFGLVIMLLLPALLAPLLLIGLGVLLARALRLPVVFAALFALGASGALLAAGSLYLDGAGRTVEGLVDSRGEAVALRAQGDWRHLFQVSLRYRLNGGAPDAALPAPEDSAATLRPTPAQFDRLRAGGPATLRVLPLFRSLALVRLADTSTRELIPWEWVGVAVAALPALWLARRLLASNRGGAALVAGVLAAALLVPGALAYRQWQASEDLAGRPGRATAEVSAVTRITRVDPFPCAPGSRSRCSRQNALFAVAQPYDIVQLQFVPEGAAGAVIAVDAVDADSIGVAPGARVAIAYAPGAGRAALILGAAHTHYWRNPLGLMLLAGGFALLVAFALWALLRRFGRAGRRAATIP